MKSATLKIRFLVVAAMAVATLATGGVVFGAILGDSASLGLPQCEDGRDNDGDGKIDWPDDPGCFDGADNDEYNSPPPPQPQPPPPQPQPPPPPPPLPKCENGIDDDADGLVDWPADPGCFDGADNDEYNSPPPAKQACEDLLDNDGDGKADYPADPGCTSAIDNDEYNAPPPPPLPKCENGIDDDGDGLIDWPNDPGCTEGPDNDEYNTPVYVCSNGLDDDGDGKVDYPNDPGCTSNNDTDEYNPPPACSDGADNDGDGKTDYPADPGCANAADTDEYNPPPPRPMCENGVDDDSDGLVDWPADPGCTEGPDNDEYNAPPPPKRCADGLDNDGDGKVDLNDPGCSSSTDDDETDPPPQSQPPPPLTPAATDGIDTPGVVRNESGLWRWYLSNDFDASVKHAFGFQNCCATPIVGDWDGDGVDSPGVNVSGSRWLLSDGYDNVVDYDFTFGLAGDRPVVGDWNGDGIDTIGVVRGSTWYLRNSLTSGTADIAFGFGNPTDKVVAGDWDGNGIDTPGVVRDSVWWLSNDHAGTVWRSFGFGFVTDVPVAGDWDGNGADSPGLKRDQWWYFSNGFTGGVADRSIVFGNPGDTGVAGDFHPDAVDTYADDAVTTSALTALAAAAETGTQALPANSPIVKYAPLVYLYSGEDNFPASARTHFLGKSRLYWSYDDLSNVNRPPVAGRGQVRAIKLGDRGNENYWARSLNEATGVWTTYLARNYTRPYGNEFPRGGLASKAGFYLDLLEGQGGESDLSKVPVYYEYSSGAYITYWFFYPFNDTQGWITPWNHEGDWERVTIKLNKLNIPTKVHFFRHGGECGADVAWSAVEKDPSTGRPTVYVANGTHGSYERAGSNPVPCIDLPGPAGYPNDLTNRGRRWETWRFLADAKQQPWYGFGGAWGDVGSMPDTPGPLGPSRFKPPAPAGW
jgi:hypothetical protein